MPPAPIIKPVAMTSNVQTILDEHGAIALPGVYDALSARIAAQAGFPLGFISGYSVAATAIGEPDIGLLTQTEIVDRARQVCSAVPTPILVDADTGYGNALNVRRTVRELIAAGAAGCFLEDQSWPKRCGHMRGKQVVDRGEYLQRIRAAVDERGGADFFIVARTDALATDGLEEAIGRVKAARDLGADACFVEAPVSAEQQESIGRLAPAPNVANMIEGGAPPLRSRDELLELGFHLILYPLAGLFAAARAMQQVCDEIHRAQSTAGARDQLMSFDEFNRLIEADQKLAIAEQYKTQQ